MHLTLQCLLQLQAIYPVLLLERGFGHYIYFIPKKGRFFSPPSQRGQLLPLGSSFLDGDTRVHHSSGAARHVSSFTGLCRSIFPYPEPQSASAVLALCNTETALLVLSFAVWPCHSYAKLLQGGGGGSSIPVRQGIKVHPYLDNRLIGAKSYNGEPGLDSQSGQELFPSSWVSPVLWCSLRHKVMSCFSHPGQVREARFTDQLVSAPGCSDKVKLSAGPWHNGSQRGGSALGLGS